MTTYRRLLLRALPLVLFLFALTLQACSSTDEAAADEHTFTLEGAPR